MSCEHLVPYVVVVHIVYADAQPAHENLHRATHSCASQPLRVCLVAQPQQIRSDCGTGRLQALQYLRPEEVLSDGDENAVGE